jgi:hypothetical protein
MKFQLLSGILALYSSLSAHAVVIYSSPTSPPTSSAWGTYFTGTPSDPNATPYYYYFYDGFIVWGTDPGSLTVGQQYDVDVSWAANAGHNTLATVRLEINDTNAVDGAYWDHIFTIDQTKLANGSAPTAAPEWSGWKNIGTFTATHDAAAFAWDFTAGNTGPDTTGTVRLTAVPEPAASALLVCTVGILGLRRRRTV